MRTVWSYTVINADGYYRGTVVVESFDRVRLAAYDLFQCDETTQAKVENMSISGNLANEDVTMYWEPHEIGA